MSLTPTEERIAGLVAIGHRNTEVAAQLRLSPKTVEWHLSRLYHKLGVRSRTELSVVLLQGNPLGPNGPKDEPNGRLPFGPTLSGSQSEAGPEGGGESS
jgi:DNA-binding CsgD family transcriptional regulator